MQDDNGQITPLHHNFPTTHKNRETNKPPKGKAEEQKQRYQNLSLRTEKAKKEIKITNVKKPLK